MRAKTQKRATAFLAVIAAIAMAFVMLVGSSMPAFAQNVGGDTNGSGKGQITIQNAAKGTTYTIYKLFGATVTSSGDGITYTGTIPSDPDMSTYFEESNGQIVAKDAAWKDSSTKTEMSDGLKSVLKTWAGNQTSNAGSAVSDGTALNFNNLDYGYYVVTTSQGNQAITVTSTKPTATIYDKNSTTPVKNLTKSVDDDDVNIGDTVTYTVSFETSNYSGSGEDAKAITKYVISDTLPDFLSDVTVTSIKIQNNPNADTSKGESVNEVEYKESDQVPQFGTDSAKTDTYKRITIPWYNSTDKEFNYTNGAKVIITYTATVTNTAAIDGSGNTNKVTIKPYTGNNEVDPPDGTKWEAEETIYTYAIALKKVDTSGTALKDATFQLPFYVSTTTDNNGAYIYGVSNDDYAKLTTEQKNNYTNSLTTPDSGELVIKGVQSGTYSLTETAAPDGYNKLAAAVSVKAEKTGQTTTKVTKYIDANGDVTDTETNTTVTYTNNNLSAATVIVINKTGAELPSTGGIGTTIFYVIGGLVVAGAVVALAMRRRRQA